MIHMPLEFSEILVKKIHIHRMNPVISYLLLSMALTPIVTATSLLTFSINSEFFPILILLFLGGGMLTLGLVINDSNKKINFARLLII